MLDLDDYDLCGFYGGLADIDRKPIGNKIRIYREEKLV
ncbi:hypothetical protein LEP1GSC188_3580 [Leptospira weilii serovar Topaz str. LT2116]|uniref:Uncharacterized protein n=1 Tax=Leptospira weilii serovar Topaz str. LT2116 TaxID=1088540 RepID=M3G4Z2_9LEPT|nr:hypothetical protein LEP1GSC188_3580 [Leptospira weilii serovar Topaz str. LT2116]